ncbi:hypothetical protein ACGFYZ_29240 [Streptomyces sp. NPDC048330]|uniref:hypothetical protein n=1 Tax=Streptomyces sp. NPDC048330 TaxID=3365533 RepID=UPI00371FD11C
MRSPRRLATLLPALLCAIWSLLLLPPATGAFAATATATAPARGAVTQASASGDGAPVAAPPPVNLPAPASPATPVSHHAAPPEPQLADTTVMRLPATVENLLRYPGAPAAPTVTVTDVPVPVRGVLVGDPRRERAPPGGAHRPRDPRGPPSTRHD